MRKTLTTIYNGVGALLICVAFIMYMGVAATEAPVDVLRLGVCAMATMGCGLLLSHWKV